MPMKETGLRSRWEFGEASECRRGLMRGMGYSDEELNRPLVGIINSWNEFNPGHVHLKELAERVKQGVREAGGLPLEVMTTGICDGMCLKDPRYIEIPSRNLIADQVELTVEGNFFDGMVMLGTCDSIVPGYLMAAARLDIPAILVTGGYMPPGQVRGREVLHIHAQDKVGTMQAGRMDPEEYEELIAGSWGICGACTSMTTANSMCMAAEVMGITLPGNSTMSAVSPRLRLLSYQAGLRIVELIRNQITARQILTPESIQNAIRLDMAVAGSSNLILHIPAIAHEAGYDLPWWKYFDETSNSVPLLSNLAPGGPYSLKDLDLAGGLPALLKNLMPRLYPDCMTVNGRTLRENTEGAEIYNPDVIRTLESPVTNKPGIGVLYGNLAPEGAILKIVAVPQELWRFEGCARVYDSLAQGLAALRSGEIRPHDAIILRYMGLKGRFGTTAFPFQEELKGYPELYHTCAILTDGRFSGGTSGLSIGYISPEAALGGPLAAVRDGDRISVDVEKREVRLELTDEEIQERLKDFRYLHPCGQYPRYLNLFVENVSSMAKGGIWERS